MYNFPSENVVGVLFASREMSILNASQKAPQSECTFSDHAATAKIRQKRFPLPCHFLLKFSRPDQ